MEMESKPLYYDIRRDALPGASRCVKVRLGCVARVNGIEESALFRPAISGPAAANCSQTARTEQCNARAMPRQVNGGLLYDVEGAGSKGQEASLMCYR